ncbi:MAG: type IV pilus twitching motility protein PilT [Bdellovibrionota bacterium]
MNDLQKKFLAVLQLAVQQHSSDIHFLCGMAPALRVSEGLAPVNCPVFTAEEIASVAQMIITDPVLKTKVNEIQDLDGSFEVKGLGRFRFNVYRTVQGMGIVLRVIPTQIPSIDDLKLPGVLRKIADASRGLILVTGATGSGKSTTLAAMIDYLNANQALHILTVEDPVEYLHPQKKCRVSQRELGRDTASYGQALKSALRQDPDVILVGEMRDYETLDIALKASETGHLVFSTVHTSDCMKTIGRLISLYPAEEQDAARMRLADNLHAIISQRLIPGKDGKRVVAQEILINNFGIAECIADRNKTGDIPSYVEKGKEVSGMQTFDQALVELAQNGLISVATALEFATNPADFKRNLSFGNTATSIIETGPDGVAKPEAEVDAISLENYDGSAPDKAAPADKRAAAPPGLPKVPKIPKAA